LVPTDVKVKGSDLPVGSSLTSSPTLVVIKHRTMAITPTSHTERMDALCTSVVVENRCEDVGHDDEEVG